jgi:hypothetical protein
MFLKRVLTCAGVVGTSVVLLTATAGMASACPSGDSVVWSAPSLAHPKTKDNLKPLKCYNVQGRQGEKANLLENHTKNSVANLFSEPNCGGGIFIDAVFPPGSGNPYTVSHKEYYSFNVSPLNGG